jgi:MFS-type transporter involved in bile tolerance (Atg22 family)
VGGRTGMSCRAKTAAHYANIHMLALELVLVLVLMRVVGAPHCTPIALLAAQLRKSSTILWSTALSSALLMDARLPPCALHAACASGWVTCVARRQ